MSKAREVLGVSKGCPDSSVFNLTVDGLQTMEVYDHNTTWVVNGNITKTTTNVTRK